MTHLAREEFLAAMSHELRTPLNSILGFAQVLLSELDGPLNAGQREDVEAIESAGSYLSTLVREVLETSAENTAEFEAFGPLNFTAIANDAARLFGPEARKSRMEIEVRVAPDLPRVFGSTRATRQVLLNLVGNAVKHGAPGPIRIHAYCVGDVLELGVTNRSLTLLHPDDAPFDAFARGSDDSTSEGWGLGLAIASELAARMAGAIDMRSMMVGDHAETTFALLIPTKLGRRLGPSPNEASMPTRTHFVAAMSHELRAPLGSISGFASLLDAEIEGALTEAQRLSVQRIRQSAESLIASLNDILDTAKADVGRIALVKGPVDPLVLLEDVAAASRAYVEHLDPPCTIFVSTHGHTSFPIARVDARRIVQATLCLVRHALRTGTPTTLEVSLRAPSVPGERSILFTVTDRERQSDQEETEAAFDPFSELHDASGRRILGLGLSLALARKLARMHDGDVWPDTSRGTAWLLQVPTD